MKSKINNLASTFCSLAIMLLCIQTFAVAQEMEVSSETTQKKRVKNTFESVWIIDNQTVIVPVEGTFEFDIAHRFGTMRNGTTDLWGLFAPSNIRFGVSYVPIKNLCVGVGLTKDRMILDGSLKYALLQQTKDSWEMPVSLTYYGNMSYDMKEDPDHSLYREKYDFTDRLRFFNQILIARKITDKFSVQVGPSLSHQNFVYGYKKQVDSATTEIAGEMKHDHFAISVAGRYKVTESMALIANYDQPITKHTTGNPNPNISFGIEMATSGHAFQIFIGNYSYLNPQRNNLFNRNDPLDEAKAYDSFFDTFLIGFNITRLWN